jgi:hypothetical protein
MSTISFFSAKRHSDLRILNSFLDVHGNKVCFLSKFRKQFYKCQTTLCLGSILAWILNTNPDIFSSLGSTNLVSDSFGLGDGAIETKQSVLVAQIIQCRTKENWLFFRLGNPDDQT